jgi:hypothetical protein
LVALKDKNPQNDGTNTVSVEERQRERAILMRHVHLSKLVNHGYIDWDQESNHVIKGPRFDEIRPLLALFAENGDALLDDEQSD